MKIIILIIASFENERYIQMQEIWRKYMNLHPNIKSYFIVNDPYIKEDILLNEEENTIYCREVETWSPGITNKTVQAIDYCLQNYDFDYIYRTNLSSFLHLHNLYNFVEKNPYNYAGVIGNHEGFHFTSGSGFLLSKNACLYLITEQQNLLKYDYLDDVCIGILLKPIFGIQYIDRCNIDIDTREDDVKNIINEGIFHYRCKSDNDHCYTIPIMNKLYDNVYGCG